jgi:hypothetical protein
MPYPGVPKTVSPEVYEHLKATHPQFDYLKPVLDVKLAAYNEADPPRKLTEKQQEEADREAEVTGTLEDAAPRTEAEMVEQLQAEEQANATIRAEAGLEPTGQVNRAVEVEEEVEEEKPVAKARQSRAGTKKKASE